MIRPTSIKTVKLTYVSISTFFLIEVSHILPSCCKGWFNGVVAITSASHAEGREFEPRLTYIFSLYIIMDKYIIHDGFMNLHLLALSDNFQSVGT